MKSGFHGKLLPLGIIVLLAGLCFGQTQTARLQGTIHDASGAIVPNAKVVAVNDATRESSDATTNSSGVYVLPALRSGVYTLNVEAAGFSKSIVTGIELAVSDNKTQDVTLDVGKMTEVVEVAANAVAVTTADAQVSAAVTINEINNLPQLARQPIQLTYFQPGVAISQNGSNAGADYSYSHINGMRQGSNNNTLDGIDVNDAVAPRLGLAMTANNTDSVEEFRVVTEGGKAEYGRNAGGQIELITRSGTNQYHGGLFEYLRNTALNANDFFSNKSGVAKPMFIQNMFGGNFGGPIKHNKLFIFGNVQARRTHQQVSRNRTVPTDLAKQGIYQWIAGGTTQQFNILNADPRHLGIDPTIASLLKIYPSSNNNDVGDGLNYAGYRFNNPANTLEDQFTIKADYNLKDNQHIFARVSWQRNSGIDTTNSADAYFPGQPQGTQGGRRWGVAGGWDWTIDASTVNQFRYGHQSATTDFVRPDRVAGTMYSFNQWTMPIYNAFAQGRNSPVNEYTDNLTKIHGNHTIKVGGNFRFTTQWGYNDAGIYPNASLSSAATGNTPPAVQPAGLNSTQLTIFQGLYNNLLGRVGSVAQTFYSDLNTWQAAGTPRVRNFVFHEYGLFVQDDWKLSRNLTLNLGLRWDFSGVPSETSGFQGTLNQAANLNTVSQIDNLTIQKGSQWYNNDWNNFAPRLGLAWDPKGDGKTAIRANYGVFYDRIIGATTSLVDGNTPGFSQSVTVYPNQTPGSDLRIADGVVVPSQPAVPVLTLPATRSTSVVAFNPNLRTGYVQMWSLNIQRQILKDTVIQAGYVANHSTKMFMNQDIDQVHPNATALAAFNELASNYNAGTLANVSPNNVFVKMMGSASSAVSTLGASNLQTAQYNNAVNNVEQSANVQAKYQAAGVSEYFLRNYPQFLQLIYGTNSGSATYNSFQFSIHHQTKSYRIFANYTFSKSLDNISAEGNGFTDVMDNYNLGLNKGRSDFDRPQVFNLQGLYTLPIGRGHALGGGMPKWADALIGGWDVGGLAIWESGGVMTASSGRYTALSYGVASWDNYTGSRNIGSTMRRGDGVYFIDPSLINSFTYPLAGDYGNAGRNTFRGPRFFNVDASLVKSFAITETKKVVFRAEAYNLLNNVDFGNPSLAISSPATFGKISGVVNNPRLLQGALRFDF
ncbi:MAG: TonB-dependent receptor [Candidatus Sulfopaludibacter sp.]|nr:TonB-dependent receptor [Candidatus Sulfopaludibacter sp.]